MRHKNAWSCLGDLCFFRFPAGSGNSVSARFCHRRHLNVLRVTADVHTRSGRRKFLSVPVVAPALHCRATGGEFQRETRFAVVARDERGGIPFSPIERQRDATCVSLCGGCAVCLVPGLSRFRQPR